MTNQKILGLIPARGGSKRIPNKNIALLEKVPLIVHTIKVALEAKEKGFITYVIVSTDSEEIAEVAKKNGADVPFMRPAEYASDTATDTDVCRHAISELSKKGTKPDAILILRPTQPFRTVNDIKEATTKFSTGKYDSIRSLTKTEHHPHWMKKLDGDYAKPFMQLDESEENVRSQDLPPVYRLNGMVDITSITNLDTTSLYGQKMGYILIDQSRSIDIDTPTDFFIAECILKKNTK
jgi:CMP-N-acetylneuraminic acid synthetase